MSDTTNLQLPYLAAQQAQKHVTVNEALRRLDAVVQLTALSATTFAEPASPTDGACYILPPGKTGAAWGPMANHAIAYYVDGAWSQITPRAGWRAWIADRGALHIHDGAGWISPYADTLTADRTYYVNGASGSDANDGRDAGAAFATIQKAVDTVAALNIAPYEATIEVAAGTYAESVSLPTIRGRCEIVGDVAAPANVVISGAPAFSFSGAGASWTVKGFRLTGAFGLFAFGGRVDFGAIDFKNTATQLLARDFGALVAIDDYEISANCNVHAYSERFGVVIIADAVMTLTGTPAFATAFAKAVGQGNIKILSMTFSGAATGKRYEATLLSLIDTVGGGAAYLPGDAAGSVDASSVYG